MIEIGIFLLKPFAKNQDRTKWLAKNLKLANLYRMHENFQDLIYGVKSRLAKDIWLESVAK